MKLNPSSSARRAGFALLLVMILAAVFILVLAASMNRSSTVATLNQRNNDYNACCNAAEAAVEKAYAHMAYDFQSYGPAQVTNHLSLYQTDVPSTTDDFYWTNFVFSDGTTINKTYVAYATNYSGNLPSAYTGLFTANAPVYRIVSNVRLSKSMYNVVGTAQEDILLAEVPLNTWAIFYNGTLEFSDCATMVVNGRVQANGPIDVGTSASLTFNGIVSTTSANIFAPNLDGTGTSDWNPAKSSTWNTTFNAGSAVDAPSVTVSLNMTNSHFMIDLPTSSQTGSANANSSTNAEMLYNEAQMVLLVTNTPGNKTNSNVQLILQASYNGQVPGADSSPTFLTYTNVTQSFLNTNMPFLSLTNMTYDQRQGATNLFTQIDVGKLSNWVTTNKYVQGKLPASQGIYPTILYVADNRPMTATQLPSVRLMDAAQLPANGGLGFTVATKNPLYVQGNYNVKTSAGTSTGTNNAYEVPAALISDALTILSPNWTDSEGYKTFSSSVTADNATADTINAAIVTGTMPSTGSSTSTFSGGVHNLPRLLEDWSNIPLYLNTSIIRLWNSKMATNQWKYQGTYYLPPNRFFSYDNNFNNAAKVPPGIPVALVPIRFNWCVPPPGTVSYDTSHN
jgi:hypothetical protein